MNPIGFAPVVDIGVVIVSICEYEFEREMYNGKGEQDTGWTEDAEIQSREVDRSATSGHVTLIKMT